MKVYFFSVNLTRQTRSPGPVQKVGGSVNSDGAWALLGGAVLEVFGEADFGIGTGLRRRRDGYWEDLFSGGTARERKSTCCLEEHEEGQVVERKVRGQGK